MSPAPGSSRSFSILSRFQTTEEELALHMQKNKKEKTMQKSKSNDKENKDFFCPMADNHFSEELYFAQSRAKWTRMAKGC
uniref:Uncharacterized protein n=1 Tax=Daphnia galeata TaxID=27404 RepID=A0A8J2WJN5_9CRUS|nr:unnamed protein product [Daphnia galeata]